MNEPAEFATARRPLRIAIDAREWRIGTSTGIARVLAAMVRWVNDHTEHDLILLGNHETEFRAEGPRIELRVAPENSRLWWDQVVVRRMLQSARADVFVSPYYKGPLRAPCPVVVTASDLVDLELPRGGILRRAAHRAWMRLMLRNAAHVLTLSEYSRNDIIARLDIPPAHITILPLAPDERFLRPVGDAALRATRVRLQLPEQYVLYVGRCAEHKNVTTLVEAWRALPVDLQRSHPLVLAGSDRERFRHESRAAGIEAVLPGFVADDEMPALYRGATLLCFPSLYEGFGLPPLEAMACGVAVVASDVSAIPEAVGGAALLVDPLDVDGWRRAIEQLITDEPGRRRLARAGADRARDLRQRHSGAELLACLASAAEQRR